MNDLFRNLLFLPDQATEYAKHVDYLHYFVITITMLMSLAVGLGTVGLFWRFRRKALDAKTPLVTPSWQIEAGFVAIPLLFFLTWFVIGFRDFVWLQTPPKDSMDVYVMGKQWMWKFAYPEGPNAISTLRVPQGRPVRLLLTSRDVIHSFYVPAFRLKMDALPGRYTQTWFTATKPGRYPIFCAEYCGLSHSGMWGEVVVMPQAEYDSWLQEQKRTNLAARQDSRDTPEEGIPADSSLVEQGRQVAVQHACFKCHTTNGEQHIGPTWLDLYGKNEKLDTGETVHVDEAYMTMSMMDPRSQIVAGYQPVMPVYRGELTAPETAALVEYIKSLHTDRIVQEGSKGPSYEPVRGQ